MAVRPARILGAIVLMASVAVLWNTDEKDIIPPEAEPEESTPNAPGVAAAVDGSQRSSDAGGGTLSASLERSSPANRVPEQGQDSPTTAAPQIAPSAQPQPADTAALEIEMGQVELMIRQYREVLGENPVGTNAEIMQAVLGDNLRQAKFELPEGQHLNEKGELVDRWGTPYFFHQISRTRMEIRSAGPDRKMWTGDDMRM